MDFLVGNIMQSYTCTKEKRVNGCTFFCLVCEAGNEFSYMGLSGGDMVTKFHALCAEKPPNSPSCNGAPNVDNMPNCF